MATQTLTRRRVERCLGAGGYAPGWVVMRDTGEVECFHATHGDAVTCGLSQAAVGRHGG